MNPQEQAAWDKLQAQAKSLQNAANKIGAFVHIVQESKPNRKAKFCIGLSGDIVSPTLDYDKMNHFILGWIRANEFSEKSFLNYIHDFTDEQLYQAHLLITDLRIKRQENK